MKKILLISILLFLLFPLASQQINWIEDYDSALTRAQQTGQNILVLLTAPSWCTYCQWLEENTLKDPQVINLLNQGFVATYITDENPQVDQFDFEGFPSMQLFSPQGELLEQAVGAVDSQSFMTTFRSYSKEELNSGDGDPIKLYGRETSQRTQDLMEYFQAQGIAYEFYDVTDPAIKSEIKGAIEDFGWEGSIYLPVLMIGDLIYFPPN
ncbi:MAG: thioredoxin family protein [Spirochaetaceae bacterium]|jgi:thioredoxin-related protein|nr:thioredoxin family protein [Spirochaetaceae bacterium]